MNQLSLVKALEGLSLGEIAYLNQVGSTNDLAKEWVARGVPDLSVIVANEQSAGRGRSGRKWFTPAGSALAMSVVITPMVEEFFPSRFSGLGALAVCDALDDYLHLLATIKWPNDVLVNQRKLGGVLAEACWSGNTLEGIIIGIGVNVRNTAIPPDEELNYPATSIEDVLGQEVSRLQLLRKILEKLIIWRSRMHTEGYKEAWEERLTFLDQQVQILIKGKTPLIGKIAGLTTEGNLQLELPENKLVTIQAGELRLRPVDRKPK